MIRRDFLQAEIDKLAQVFAKILGLKEASNFIEANDLLQKTLAQSFEMDLQQIAETHPEQLKEHLLIKNLPPQKLDLLAKFLLESVVPFQQKTETFTTLKHVLTIYQVLEQEHHVLSFENLNQQQIIHKFLDQPANGQP